MIAIANYDDIKTISFDSDYKRITAITLKDGAKFKKYSEDGDNSDSNNNE